jgi:hypothetical protein
MGQATGKNFARSFEGFFSIFSWAKEVQNLSFFTKKLILID